jgi:hypothetical protein
MLDFDTFLTTLYVKVDDFCKSFLPDQPKHRPGPKPSLSVSEVVTLSIVGQWQRWWSERDFYRWAKRHLQGAFPTLPTRPQFNRLQRQNYEVMVYFFLSLASQVKPNGCAYEALDATGVATRHAKRRGSGHLAGLTDLGYSNRLGWYHGFHLLVSSTPDGLITGYGFASASVKDQPLAETFLELRATNASLLPSVGNTKSDYYVMDKGFEGQALHQHWQNDFGAKVVCAPKRSRNPLTPPKWPKALRRWIASVRQIIESVNGKLMAMFRLDRERPHDLVGFMARLAAKVALHNFCFWCNCQLGRDSLAFAELIDW